MVRINDKVFRIDCPVILNGLRSVGGVIEVFLNMFLLYHENGFFVFF